MTDVTYPSGAWSTCHASMVQCHATLLDVCASTAASTLREHCVSLLRCVDVCRHLCMCAVADHGGRAGQADESHRHLMTCCAHRLHVMTECCGRVVRACSDRAMRANDPLTKRILAGGGDAGLTDTELMDHLYRMFAAGADGGVRVENKVKRDDSALDMGDHASLTRSKQKGNNTNVLINAFMKVLPNLVVTSGDNNKVYTGHDERASRLPTIGTNENDRAPSDMSRSLFEQLLRDVKRVEDDALECIDLARDL